MPVITVSLLAATAIVAMALLLLLQRQNSAPSGRELEPASRPGSGITFPYYIDEHALHGLARSIDIEIPTQREKRVSDGDGVKAAGANLSTELQFTVQLATSLNLAVFARRIRALDKQYVSSGLALLPEDIDASAPSSLIVDAKIAQFKDASNGKLVLLRGHLELLPSERSSPIVPPIHLRLTHADFTAGLASARRSRAR